MELLEYLKSWFRLRVVTKENLHAIVGSREEGSLETLEETLVRTVQVGFGRCKSLDGLFNLCIASFWRSERLDQLSGPLQALNCENEMGFLVG